MDELIDRITKFRGDLEEARDKYGADLMDEAIQALRELQQCREVKSLTQDATQLFREWTDGKCKDHNKFLLAKAARKKLEDALEDT